MAKKKYPKASEEFWDSIIFGSSNVIECEFCKRIHFADDPASDYDEGELEKLYKDNRSNPNKTIFHIEPSVRWGYLDGKQIVYNCPCNSAARYEKLFWENRSTILDYLMRRLEKMEQTVKKEKDLSQKVYDLMERKS